MAVHIRGRMVYSWIYKLRTNQQEMNSIVRGKDIFLRNRVAVEGPIGSCDSEDLRNLEVGQDEYDTGCKRVSLRCYVIVTDSVRLMERQKEGSV